MSMNKKLPAGNSLNTQLPEDVAQKLDEGMGVLVLVSGTLTNGQTHYAYASIPPSKYVAFKEAEAAGHYNLADFGNILAHGEGEEPPTDVKQRMEEEYGANHYLEEELGALLTQLHGQAQEH